MITKEQIQEAANKIVELVQPEKLYLFGSYARGNATEESDVDFLIIMPDKTKKKFEVVDEIEKHLGDTLPIFKDIIVDYMDRYQRFCTIPFSMIGHVVKTGVLLYES